MTNTMRFVGDLPFDHRPRCIVERTHTAIGEIVVVRYIPNVTTAKEIELAMALPLLRR